LSLKKKEKGLANRQWRRARCRKCKTRVLKKDKWQERWGSIKRGAAAKNKEGPFNDGAKTAKSRKKRSTMRRIKRESGETEDKSADPNATSESLRQYEKHLNVQQKIVKKEGLRAGTKLY